MTVDVPDANTLQELAELWPVEIAMPEALLDVDAIFAPDVVQQLSSGDLVRDGMLERRIETAVRGLLAFSW